jgi:hypothetical protein
MIDKDFRTPSSFEKALLIKLTDQKFKGRQETLEQLKGIQVKQLDDHGGFGCLALRPISPAPLPVRSGPIVEGCYVDVDTRSDSENLRTVHILLHVLNYMLVHLEMYREDGSEIFRKPEIEELEVFLGHPAKD